MLMNSVWICCTRPVLQRTKIIWYKTCLVCFPSRTDHWAGGCSEQGLFPVMLLTSPGWCEVWYPALRRQSRCCADQSRQHILISTATRKAKALMYVQDLATMMQDALQNLLCKEHIRNHGIFANKILSIRKPGSVIDPREFLKRNSLS